MAIDINRADARGGSGPLLTLRQAASGGERANWQAGQVLRATVVSFTPQGHVNLDVDGSRLQSNQSALGLQAKSGQSLRLEVVEAGKLPVLRVLEGGGSPQEAARQAAREALPRQASLEQVLQRGADQLRQIAGGAGTTQQANAARQVLSALPDAGRMTTAEGVRQAVSNSGLFLENHLGQQARGGPATPLSQDLKANMLRLLSLMRPAAAAEAGARPAAAQGGGNAQTSGQMPLLTYPAPSRGALLQATGQMVAQGGGGQSPAAGQPAAGQVASSPQATAAQAAGSSTPLANPSSAQQTASGQAGSSGATAQGGAASVAAAGVRATDLVQQLEAGLSRIQLNQIASSGAITEGTRPQWHVELPLRGQGGEVTPLTIALTREREGDGDTIAPLWTVNLHFELSELGPIRAGLTLVGERHVSVGLWARDEETVALFEAELDHLRESMVSAGLTVGHVGVRQGAAEPPSPASENLATRLLDEEA
ncbi:MAG: flagellar hook-length control protein FliK [Pseudomonadota bacterium]